MNRRDEHSLSSLTVEAASALSYVDLLSILEETNRCPGGLGRVHEIAQETFMTRDSSVLEIGSNTGFTSLELSRMTACTVHGIDPNARAVAVAESRAKSDIPRIQQSVSFSVASAYDLPFSDDTFDITVVGGSFSFMDAKSRALREVVRTLKPWGWLSVTNLCYEGEADLDVLQQVSHVIGSDIKGYGAGDWADLYDSGEMLQRCRATFVRLGSQPQTRVDSFVEYFANKPHLAVLSDEVKAVIINRWAEIIALFNRNHVNIGYVALLYRKVSEHQEPELFVPQSPQLVRLRQADW